MEGKSKYQCPILGCPFDIDYIDFGEYLRSAIKHHDQSRHGLYDDRLTGS